jgi:V-type H+-transporting ATPase subunit d
MMDEPSPILVSTITKKCYEKLADEFNFLKAQTVEPLNTFMEFIAREKMIDNVVMIIQGALNNKAPKEMEEKIHPLGTFEGMKVIMSESFDVQGGFDDVYRIFLVDTPIGKYFEAYLEEAGREKDEMAKPQDHTGAGAILTKQDLEIMKACLKKAWLEDFNNYCQSQGGTTAEVMGHLLNTEADFRVLLVSLNALGTAISTEDKLQERNNMYPGFGYLYPEGQNALRKAWNESTVKAAVEPYPRYQEMYDKVKQFYDQESGDGNRGSYQSIEDLIYSENVKMYEMAFEQQYHYGVFFSWIKLREQEIRNIRWICNMIVLNTKDHIEGTIVPIFAPRMG